ncbi:ABC transporter ATP-binding protein [Brevibacillus sp. RS1.1]|uniref:ABC transporter ATP-binding protein n=1 Tax=Brevibacillus sp. RS1.1 TaxID=2738982 RepID=UPI00156AC9AB|nr:ABC transporter ATP-binding protein [Brevibacillus sp. RS1.1]NRR03368.1 ABC transporter ATP-binding protein [Brevibacillus sp. RS1.1]
MSYVQIERVEKNYAGTSVLQQVSLQIEKGEFITLLGPSGCGKSTLLRCIAGLETADSGTITVNGTNITNLSPQKRNVGMVFQSYALFPNMTVFDNIAFGLKMQKMDKIQTERKVRQVIELIHLSEKEKAYPHELSGGQQQRVALARAIVTEPDILLLDEPLSALDAKIRKSLQMELRNIQNNLQMTMIFVTHDQEEAMTISDRIFVMDQGEVVQSGVPEHIYASPKNEFVARFIGSYNVLTHADIYRLTGESLQAGTYAVRPEVIGLFDSSIPSKMKTSGYWVNGSVMSVTIKGNVRRYEIQANDCLIHADELNVPQTSSLTVGMQVQAWIPEKECILL